MDIVIPELHKRQREIYAARGRFNRVRCGRRWGKTVLAQAIASSAMANGKNVGWFVPQYKILAEAYNELYDLLQPVITSSNKIEGEMRIATGGKTDFWTLENERAGRSRKYHVVIIDEAAFTKPNMLDIWQKSIKPTLLDYVGSAWVCSTPNGMSEDNFFYRICAGTEDYGFIDHHAPTHSNPFLPQDELLKLEKENHPMVFRQEYLAEFVDWSGSAFFGLDNMLNNGYPLPYPEKTDAVFAVIDTAVKGGKDNDGTAIVYCALDRFPEPRIVMLDWDIVQVDGALLESWMPSVFERCEELSRKLSARNGFVGVWIEDAAAGSILLQQGRSRGWLAHSIDSKLTMAGKDERAISVSGYVHQGKVKISDYAYDKVASFKGISKNHLVSQLTSFRIGDKDAYRRSDDLLDAAIYCMAIGLGDKYGY